MARWKTVTLRLKIKIYQCTRVKTPTFDEIRTYLGLDLDAAGAVIVPDEPDEGWVVDLLAKVSVEATLKTTRLLPPLIVWSRST